MLGEWEGRREGGREGRACLLPPVLYFFRKDAIISPQEGGTAWIIRQCGSSGWGHRHPRGHFLFPVA